MKSKIKIMLINALILFGTMANTMAAEVPNYRIGPGDVLEISVWRDESLSREVVVPPDGVISFPLIGDIDSKNITVGGIREIITRKLEEYVQDVVVTVMLLEINSLKAYVIGKVNNPGVFPISLDTDVMQILSMAGGLNPFASEKHIHILRRENDELNKIPFNYREMLKGDNLDQNIILQRGDIVVVP